MAFGQFLQALFRGTPPSDAFGEFTGAVDAAAFADFVRPTRTATAFDEFAGSGAAGPVPPGVVILFGCEWTAALGQTEQAFRNGLVAGAATWEAYNGVLGNDAAEIIAPTGLTTRGNAFRVYNRGENNLTVRTDLMVPALTTHWGRLYVRNDKTVGAHNHPIAIGGLQDPPASIENVPLVVTGTATGTQVQVQCGFDTNGVAVGYPHVRWTPGAEGVAGQLELVSGQWYLWEWALEYTGARYQMRVWVSEVDGTGAVTNADIFTAATFFREDYFGAADGSLEAIQSATATYFGLTDSTNARQYVLGNEGPGSGSANGEHFSMCSFALSTEGRIRDQALAA